MKKVSIRIFGILILWQIASGCTSPPKTVNEHANITIAISKAVPEASYQSYIRWIRYPDSTVAFFDMYHLDIDSAIALLSKCDALLLTGGTDLFPGRYGKESDTARCWEPDFKRDTLESLLFTKALSLGMPVMGICRGLQLINAEMGGTLHIDLPVDLDTLVNHRLADGYGARHEIIMVEKSLLHQISGIEKDTVNSAHHQGIELLGKGLIAQAYAEDGLIESIALKNDSNQFLLGVQWHPERMDYTSPLSGKLAIRFIEEAKKFKILKNHE